MFDDYGEDYDRHERPRDRKVDEARAVLLERFFPAEGRNVYYGRQLEVALEDQFFHWITKKALNELASETRINFAVENTEHHTAHFYWPRRHRYPRRQIRETLALIAEFSHPVFTRAGRHHWRAACRCGLCPDWLSDSAKQGAGGGRATVGG
jgi:hypothetical protein